MTVPNIAGVLRISDPAYPKKTKGYMPVDDASTGQGHFLIEDIFTAMAPEFKPNVACVVGHPYWYPEDGYVYRCTVAHTGAWNPDHFTRMSTAEALQASIANILNAIASEFVPNVATVKNRLYWHDNALYLCTVAYTGVWNPDNFTAVTLGDLITLYGLAAATETDLVAGSKIPIMTADGPKSLPGNAIAKASEQTALTTYAHNVAHSIAPEFDPTRDSEHAYPAGYSVMYTDGKTYTFMAPHYGAWTGTDVYITEPSAIKFYPITWTSGKYINIYGELTDNANYSISDYIPIPAGGVSIRAWLYKDIYFAVYDRNKQLLKTVANNLVSPDWVDMIITPDVDSNGASFVRISNRNGYDAYAKVVEDFVSKPLSIGSNNFSFDFSKIPLTWQDNTRIASTGAVTTNSATGYKVSGYVKIPLSGLRYLVHITTSQRLAVYDADKTLKGLITPTSSGDMSGVIKRSDFDFEAVYVRFCTSMNYPYYVLANENLNSLDNAKKFIDSVGMYKIGFVVHDDTTNFIDKNLAVKGLLCNGGPQDGGECTPISGDYWVTVLIRLKPSTTYAYKSIYPTNYAFFDENKNYVNGKSGTSQEGDAGSLSGGTFTTPANVHYARFSIVGENNFNLAYVGERCLCEYKFDGSFDMRGTAPQSNPCLYIGKEVSVFAKGIAIGDSLTQGVFNDYSGQSVGDSAIIPKYSWPTHFEKLYGVPFDNLGVGGATVESWWSLKQSADFSGHDFAVIALGTNNASASGSMWQTTTKDAFDGIINKLKTDNKGIRIFVCTTFGGGIYNNPRYAEFSQDIRDYVETLNDPQVFLVDLYAFNTSDKVALWNGHANATGYLRIAQDIGSYISSIIALNFDKFKDVQFINTDYQYDPD